MVLRVKPTPIRLTTNILSALVDSTPVHSIPSVWCPRGRCCRCQSPPKSFPMATICKRSAKRSHHYPVDPARYCTPWPKIGLPTRECGMGKIYPSFLPLQWCREYVIMQKCASHLKTLFVYQLNWSEHDSSSWWLITQCYLGTTDVCCCSCCFKSSSVKLVWLIDFKKSCRIPV